MKSLPFIIFGLTVIAQWAASLSQIWTHENVLSKGEVIRVKCTAPDPYDPLRGRFLAVRPEQTRIKLPSETDITRGTSIYCTLTPGADGLHTISDVNASPPKTGTFLKATAGWIYEKEMSIEWPFDRYYLNEKLAPEADKWFAENIRTAKGIVAEARVLGGRAVLTDLTLDGQSFRELLKERQK